MSTNRSRHKAGMTWWLEKLKAEDGFGDFVCFVGAIVSAVCIEFAPAFACAATNPDFHRGPLEYRIDAFKSFQNFCQNVFGRFIFDKERPVEGEQLCFGQFLEPAFVFFCHDFIDGIAFA